MRGLENMVLGRVHEERRLEEDGTNFNKRSKNPNARRLPFDLALGKR